MAVPSTSTFTLDLDQVIAAAMDRLPAPQDEGYDLTRSLRAVQFTFNRLLARNVHNFKVTTTSLTTSAGVVSYTLPADEHDVLEATIRDVNQSFPTDVPLERIAGGDYHNIPDKDTLGRPVKYWVERGRDARTLYFWPKPDRAFEIRYRRVSLFRDAGTMLDNLDVPNSWLSVMVAGTAYFLALTKPEIDIPTRQELERLFEKEIELIEGEDRDRAALRIVPDLSAYSTW